MKRILSLVFVSLLATLSVSAQQGANPITPGTGIRRGGVGTDSNPPVTNPEPITLVALAGGAAAAGGLLRRRKQAK